MAKIFEVSRSGKGADLNDESHVSAVRVFYPRKGVAKRAARDLNDGKRLTDASGIKVTPHIINGGRQGWCDFINGLLNPSMKKGTPAVKVKGKKEKPKKEKPKKAKAKKSK